jgi:hypothetical protein
VSSSKKSFAGEQKFERIMKEWPGKFKTVYAAKKNMNGKLWLNTQRKCKCAGYATHFSSFHDLKQSK